MKQTKKQTTKVGKVMHEYKEGSLHSGKGGPVVKSRKQAIAIAMSQANMAKKPMKKSAGRGR
jgi:ribosomal protein L21E